MNILGEKQVQELLKNKKPPVLFFESVTPDKEQNKNILFFEPEAIIVFNANDDIERFFNLLQEYQAQGYWLAGYFAYEFAYFLEESFQSLRRLYDFPLAWVVVKKTPLFIKPDRKAENLENLQYQIKNSRPSINEAGYTQNIMRIKEELSEGQTYQVNYTFKENFEFTGNFLDFYFGLRRMQPTNYCAYIDTGEMKIASLSPELFFQIRKGIISARPMKGTTARGVDSYTDKARHKVLTEDPKIRAENLMIVDLLRNDLGRVCNKVWVKSLFDVEKHSTLFQMTSTIQGKVNIKVKMKELFTALFPCGSVTGAPKIKTMQLIGDLENGPRELYTGAIGYISPQGEACFSVAIRTVVVKNGHGRLGIGGGIVYDSIAGDEYKEAALKAKFLTRHFPYFDLIETILWEKGKGYFMLKGHLVRLERSCDYFSRSFESKKAAKALQKLAKKFHNAKMVVRIVINPHGDIQLEAREFKPLPEIVDAVFNEHRLDSSNLFLYHKTTCRYWYDEALHKAKKSGYGEVIFLNDKGEVTEGSFSNIFIEQKGILYTPPVECGLLPGVLRQSLIDSGRVQEKVLFPADLISAEKVYMGNSVRGLVRVRLKSA